MEFSLKEVLEVPKMGLKALKYVHPTKLTHIHVQRQGDPNKVFSLAFKTNAPNKTGVPHILEHTTLCGSEKFPVRDPFFKMLSRSLANFMNAMTAFDYTYYPFATTNMQDFKNLQKVYMDSVFKPLLKKNDFEQEGWRLEPKDLSLPLSEENKLIFKGVVFNEMKGQMSIPAYLHYMKWFQSIYPSMQYSAGDPLHIPDLKYEDLVRFHADNYHPSNCFTFSYGDFEASEVFESLQEYLNVNPKESVREVLQPIELTSNTRVVETGPVDQMFDVSKQHKISLTWFVGDPSDLAKSMVWRVLSMLLTDGHASPFYKSLIDSGIGTEFSVNTGLEETPSKLLFTIGLQGIEESQVEVFKRAVFDTINDIKANGFPKQRVDALLHQAELSNREVDANYGMSMLSKLVGRAFHPNDDVMKLVDSEANLEEFKTLLEGDANLFKNEVGLHLGSEKPYFQFEMVPSASYESDLAALEEKKLESLLSTMTEEDKQNAVKNAIELEAAVKTPQNLDILPTVHTSDISRDVRQFPVTTSNSVGVPVIHRQSDTQGITYFRMLRELNVPTELLPYVPIYTEAVANVGTLRRSMADMEDLIKLQTGGLSMSAGLKAWGKLELNYSGAALDEKTPDMMALFRELFTMPKLSNVNKLKVLLDSSAASITNALSQNGHRYACSRASAALSHKSASDEILSGFPFVKLVQSLSKLSEEELLSELVPKLKQIHTQDWNVRAIGITSTEVPVNNRLLDWMLTGMKVKLAAPAPLAANVDEWRNARLTNALTSKQTMVSFPSFQVSHVGAALQGSTSALTDKDHASLQVLANLLTHKYLHPEIREKGGAYGGGASYNAINGLLTMYSYRDPTPQNSLDVMAKVGAFAKSTNFSERDVEEGKIGIFQSLDSPISPRHEIGRHLGLKLSSEERLQIRANLLDVKPTDLNAVAEKFLKNEQSVCVIGPQLNGFNAEQIEM